MNLERFYGFRSYPDRETIPSSVWGKNHEKPSTRIAMSLIRFEMGTFAPKTS
jgi:hypothetical protein